MTPLLARPAPRAALGLQAAVAVTAVAGGGVLAGAALTGTGAGVLTPPGGYLAGSPFTGYLLPGLLLAVVLGGLHALAFVTGLRRSAWAPLTGALAAFGLLVWIFVQMVWIPFSPLQAAYEAAGIAELGLLLVQYGVLDVLRTLRRPRGERVPRQRTA